MASGGLRALEGLEIFDFTVSYISDEATQFLKQWLEWKYHNEHRNIENPNPNDLVFTISDSKRPHKDFIQK